MKKPFMFVGRSQAALIATISTASALFAVSTASASTVFSQSDLVTTGADKNVFIASSNAGNQTGNNTATVSDGSLVYSWEKTGTSTTQNTYFLINFDDVNLAAVGSKLTVSFTLNGSSINAASQAFRLGLYNTNVSDTTTSFSTASGYAIHAGPNAHTALGFYSRPANNGQANLFSGVTQVSPTGATGKSAFYYTNGASLNYVFSVETLSDNSIRLVTQIAGRDEVSLVLTDTSLHTLFNTLAFFGQPTADGSLTISNLNVDYVAIPESSSVAIATGIVALLAVSFLRRRRR